MGTKKPKAEIIRRAKIIEGHCKKVVRMIEEDAYCVDILHQSLAVQNAMKKLDEIILEDHLNTCVLQKINKGEANEATKEIIEIFKRR